MNSLSDGLTRRALIVAALALIMIVPLALVQQLVGERTAYHASVLREMSAVWGGAQTIQAPLLVVPFVEQYVVEETIEDDEGNTQLKTKVIHHDRQAIVLPEELTIDMGVSEQYRRRGIYRALVYSSNLSLTGSFARPDLARLSDRLHRVYWDRAYLVFGLTEPKAINELSQLTWNGGIRSLAPGTHLPKLIRTGFHAPLHLTDTPGPSFDFALNLVINGSASLRFAPLGAVTTVDMRSSWPHPSFGGSALPDEYEATAAGFHATWRIPHLARSYPQSWVYELDEHDLDEFLTGVGLFEPVSFYSKITRSVKYGLLFVIVTYVAFLIFELTTRAVLHVAQYGLIGIALALFYLTLLSLTEHIGFLAAYLCAASIIVSMITAYAAAALRDRAKAAVIALLLSACYAVLYLLLRLEDYALLTGTFVLLLGLCVLMYLTRNLPAAATRVAAPTAAAEA